ncbi:XRE family transcriptional regulator [Janibacter limosus]|uniref:XRE family transcriptional regulator n=1 Tax=Janibacter limosus TaxID=53458 RepID=UPI001A90CCE8|nr:XRE family transcriptional regulator [Janibacter limosus]
MKVTAQVVRSGDWWAIEVPEFPGVFTQVKRLDQAAVMVADAVATMTGVDPSEVEVSVRASLRPELQHDVDEAIRLRHEAEEARATATRQLAQAVTDVLGAGLTVRDAATLLEISPQRVSQVARA